MTIPKTMKAVLLTGYGGPEVLDYRDDVTVPQPNNDQVLIKVAACGMNNTDVNTRVGWCSKAVTTATADGGFDLDGDENASWDGETLALPRIQGADAVGHVVAVGANADAALIGKWVMVNSWLRDWNDPNNRNKTGYFGSECAGGFAQFTVADRRGIMAVDSPLSDAELATFCFSYTTAEGMLSLANVDANDVVLVTGASGGVGSALIQLANRRGARVVAMASETKHKDVAKLNPAAILPRAPDKPVRCAV